MWGGGSRDGHKRGWSFWVLLLGHQGHTGHRATREEWGSQSLGFGRLSGLEGHVREPPCNLAGDPFLEFAEEPPGHPELPPPLFPCSQEANQPS